MTNPTDPDPGRRQAPPPPQRPVWVEDPFQQGPPTLENLPAVPFAQPGASAPQPGLQSQPGPRSSAPPWQQPYAPAQQPAQPRGWQPPAQPPVPPQPWQPPRTPQWSGPPTHAMPAPPNGMPPNGRPPLRGPVQPSWPGGPPSGPIPSGPIPSGAIPSGPPPGRRGPRRGRLIALVASVVVIAAALGVGLFFMQTSGGHHQSGAATPQAAVRAAITAVEHQNIDAALATVDPAEVKTLGALIGLARQKLSTTQVISASGLLVPGLTVTISNPDMTVRQVNPELAFVTIHNVSARAAYDDHVLPAAVRPTPARIEHAHSAGPIPFPIAVLKQDGGWYLSPTTTLLEVLRRSNGLPEPDFAAPVTLGGGASTPAGALTGLVSAVQNLNLKGAAGYISPAEVPALQYYYATFTKVVEHELSRVIGSVSNIHTTVSDMSDGLKKVTVDSADLRFSATDGTTVNGQYRNGCITAFGTGQQQDCFTSDFKHRTGIDTVFVVVENDGGTWRVSPVATVVEYARILIADGDIDAFYRSAGLAYLTPVTQTVHVGQAATIHLNDGGFAHVSIVGPAHACVSATSLDAQVQPTQSCEDGGVQLSAQGRGTAVILGAAGYQAGQTRLTFQAG